MANLVHLRIPVFPASWLLLVLGVTWMIRITYRYHGSFKPAAIGKLIEDTEVSQMRPRAVELRGEIVGNGVPGAFWSPDLVLKDETGMMFVLYRSSIPFARLFFALKNTDRFIGEKVVLEGWFRRGLRPYVEISKLTTTTIRVNAGAGPISLFAEASNNATLTPETLAQRSYSRWIQLERRQWPRPRGSSCCARRPPLLVLQQSLRAGGASRGLRQRPGSCASPAEP